MPEAIRKPFFAPQLFIKSGTTDISFYSKAFAAIELRRWNNEDGSIHVAELSINGCLFHLHEDVLNKGCFSPQLHNGTTTVIGLFVTDVDSYTSNAIKAGGILISAAQDYDYGYRQSQVKDPFGHIWMLEQNVQRAITI